MGPRGKSSGSYGAEATLEMNHEIQFFFYIPSLSPLSVCYICVTYVYGGGMGCGGQRSVSDIFLEHFPLWFVR